MQKYSKIIQKILPNRFIRVSGANGTVSILRTLASIVANKVVAVYIGTSGVAMVGQLQSLIGILSLISGGGFIQGLTKYVSQYKNEEKTVGEFISTSFVFTLFVSAVFGAITLLFSSWISSVLFLTDKYRLVIAVLGLSLIFYGLNNLFISIINGFQEYRKYFKINLITAFSGSVLSIILVILFREYGALLAIILSQSVVCVFTWFMVRNDHWIRFITFRLFSSEKLKLLSKYAIVLLLGTIIWPVVKIFIRSYVITHISIHDAGIWEATAKISDYISILVTGSFSIYLLPRLSELTDPSLIKKEIIDIYKVIVPVSLFIFTMLYLLKKQVILLLYSPDFMEVSNYLLLQMAGSFFWLCKVIPMNFLLAKEKTNLYLFLELFFCLVYIILAWILVPRLGVQGIQLSFAGYNLAYLLTCLFVLKNYLSN